MLMNIDIKHVLYCVIYVIYQYIVGVYILYIKYTINKLSFLSNAYWVIKKYVPLMWLFIYHLCELKTFANSYLILSPKLLRCQKMPFKIEH